MDLVVPVAGAGRSNNWRALVGIEVVVGEFVIYKGFIWRGGVGVWAVRGHNVFAKRGRVLKGIGGDASYVVMP